MKKTQLWTEEDCKQFIILSKKYHNDFQQIADEMNRSYSQIRSHYYNLKRKPKVDGKDSNDKKGKAKQTQQEQPFIIFDDLQ
ncbi:SANT/Myb_domain [Hexamita inflata]|uniref:SANT/Myb domain n=1 Tax=Hexamita inflata TaxID=28002 RepID=A0AA86R287_9EUKA|nr:SANT/Myb domain [Hexamita inflata]